MKRRKKEHRACCMKQTGERNLFGNQLYCYYIKKHNRKRKNNIKKRFLKFTSNVARK